MAEQTLNKQLSGTEVMEAILYDIRAALERDDRFAAHAAYSAFGFQCALMVRLPGSHVELVTRAIAGGDPVSAGDEDVANVEAERPVESPNEVRLDTEQPLPVLVRNEKDGGTREEWKRVSKHGPPKPGGGLRNKVIGGAAKAAEKE